MTDDTAVLLMATAGEDLGSRVQRGAVIEPVSRSASCSAAMALHSRPGSLAIAHAVPGQRVPNSRVTTDRGAQREVTADRPVQFSDRPGCLASYLHATRSEEHTSELQ